MDPIINGVVFIGDTANANNSAGLTINQGAADDETLSLKSSDIDHGMTIIAETDTFGILEKSSAGPGGLTIVGISEGTGGLDIQAIHTSDTTTKSGAGLAACLIVAALKSGTSTAGLGANANVLAVRTGGATRFILDADGDSHQDVGTAWTNFDAFDDVALLDALSVEISRPGDPIKRNFGEFLKYNRDALERTKLVTFNEDGHHFVNMSKLTMANTGALRQLGVALQKTQELLEKTQERLADAERKLLTWTQ
jgi:hypothetical protein